VDKVKELCETVLKCDDNGPDERVGLTQNLARWLLRNMESPPVVQVGELPPGPWRVDGYYLDDNDQRNGPASISDANGRSLLVLSCKNPHRTAVGAAVVAVPELLEALSECIERLDEIDRFTKGEWHSGSTLEIARAAYSQATGR
jgi:hypothetical protein